MYIWPSVERVSMPVSGVVGDILGVNPYTGNAGGIPVAVEDQLLMAS